MYQDIQKHKGSALMSNFGKHVHKEACWAVDSEVEEHFYPHEEGSEGLACQLKIQNIWMIFRIKEDICHESAVDHQRRDEVHVIPNVAEVAASN